MREHEIGVQRQDHARLVEIILRLDKLPEDEEPLYVICRVGGRSARVVQYLVAQGYPAINVDGGMQAWATASSTMLSPPTGPQRLLPG